MPESGQLLSVRDPADVAARRDLDLVRVLLLSGLAVLALWRPGVALAVHSADLGGFSVAEVRMTERLGNVSINLRGTLFGAPPGARLFIAHQVGDATWFKPAATMVGESSWTHSFDLPAEQATRPDSRVIARMCDFLSVFGIDAWLRAGDFSRPNQAISQFCAGRGLLSLRIAVRPD